MKRARSVAIFSLKLKEKRAAAEAKAREKLSSSKQQQQLQPQANPPMEQPSGELSCIPIEKLISVDDVSTARRRKTTSSLSNV